jgi:hypothetical protein
MLVLKFSPKDDLDHYILASTVHMFIQANISNVLTRGQAKQEEQFLSHVFDIAESLLKANEHYRKYVASEKVALAELKAEQNLNPSTVTGVDPTSLNTEIDGVTSHFKAALESTAKALNPLLGLNLNGWRKGKYKDVEKSGAKVINAIQNLNKPALTAPMVDYLERTMDWVSYIVLLRDKPHHGGKTSISPLLRVPGQIEPTAQRITHPGGTEEDVRVFLERTVRDAAAFVNGVLRAASEIALPAVVFIQDGARGEYRLGIRVVTPSVDESIEDAA